MNFVKYLFEHIEVPFEYLKSTLLNTRKETIQFLIKNDIRVGSLDDFNYFELLSLASKEIEMEPIVNNSINDIVNCNDALYYRKLIMELEKNNDVSNIESQRQRYYQNQLDNYHKDTNMLDGYHNIFQKVANIEDKNEFF